jgi:hypothetical protein
MSTRRGVPLVSGAPCGRGPPATAARRLAIEPSSLGRAGAGPRRGRDGAFTHRAAWLPPTIPVRRTLVGRRFRGGQLEAGRQQRPRSAMTAVPSDPPARALASGRPHEHTSPSGDRGCLRHGRRHSAAVRTRRPWPAGPWRRPWPAGPWRRPWPAGASARRLSHRLPISTGRPSRTCRWGRPDCARPEPGDARARRPADDCGAWTCVRTGPVGAALAAAQPGRGGRPGRPGACAGSAGDGAAGRRARGR